MKTTNCILQAFQSERRLWDISLFLLLVQLSSCIGGGTHGSIQVYEYPVTKKVLQRAVEKVMLENLNILRDTTINYRIVLRNSVYDTIVDNYYNDGERYLTLKVNCEGEINEYIFQYSGTEEEWATSRNAYLSIAYARDEEGHGGSEGNGGVTWYTPFLKKKLMDCFELEFISKVDKELDFKHVRI